LAEEPFRRHSLRYGFNGSDRPMRRTLLSAVVLVAIGTHDAAFGQSASGMDIAPSGKLRVGMIAIRVLGGIAEPVGRFVATKLGVSYEPVMYPNPEAYA